MQPKRVQTGRQGFTLIELLVVIVIIVILAVLSTVGAMKFIDKGRKVQALSQIRDLSAGLQAFSVDYQHGPIPKEKRDAGVDTVYGDPEAKYTNDFIVSALLGDPKEFTYGDSSFDVADVNPKKERYLELPVSGDNKNGVGADGILYDPWGASMMIAINTPPYKNDEAEGLNDKQMWTFGVGEYTDTKPREQEFVIWTFGKDRKKGKMGASKTTIVPFQNTDDVLSWQ